MSSTTRTAAGLLALAVALGAGTPVASAAGQDGLARPGHVKVAKGEKGEKGQKEAQGLRQVLREIAKADARLAKVSQESRLSRIGDHAADVLANVDADRAALAELAVAVQAPDSTLDLREVRREVKEVRAENYLKVANDLRHALRLAAEIAEARTALAGDPAAPLADLDAAQAAVDAAIGKALLVTAASGKDELKAVKADLVAAHASLDVVQAYLDGLADDDELSEDEPIEDEPIEP